MSETINVAANDPGDIASKIRTLFGPESRPPDEPAASPEPPPAREPESPAQEIPRAAVTEFRYNYPEPIWKGHVRLVENGTDPHDIPCVGARGKQRGCQCFTHKSERGEVFEITTGAGLPKAAIDPVVAELITEEMIADLLDLPNRYMELQTISSPQIPDKVRDELVKIWKTDEAEKRRWGEAGKRIADHYLRLPDFKHKELVLFVVTYLGTFVMKFGSMITSIRIQKLIDRRAA